MNRWYVCRTQPQREMVVVNQMRAANLETLYPTFVERRKIRHKIAEIVRPVFPRYLMVHFDFERDGWRAMARMIGVDGLLGYRNGAAPWLPDKEATAMVRAFSSPLPIKDMAPWIAGTRLQVTSGSFMDHKVEFEELCQFPDGVRVRALAALLGKQVSVYLRPNQVVEA